MRSFRVIPIWLVVIGLILAASGCNFQATPAFSTSVPPTPTAPPPQITAPEESQTPSTPTPELAPLPMSVPLERPQYSLVAVIDYQNQHLFVEESILIPHPIETLVTMPFSLIIDISKNVVDWDVLFYQGS